MKYTLAFVFFLSTINLGLAQFNIKIGYDYAYTQPNTHNQIIDQFNASNSFLNEFTSFEKLNSMHGVLLGVRHRWSDVALNLEFTPLFRLREFKGFDPTSEEEIFRKNFYRFASYSAGLEFFINKISIGGSFDYNIFRVRSEQNDRRDRYISFQDEAFGSRFFVGINVMGNEQMSISLQPYVRIPWSKFDLTDFENAMGTDSNLDSNEEGMMIYGIRLVFNNGNFD